MIREEAILEFERPPSERGLERQNPLSLLKARRPLDQKVEALSRVPLFQGLGRRAEKLIAQQADLVVVAPGQVLARQGRCSWELLVILEGVVRVQRDGQELARLGPSDFLGEISCLSGKPQPATYIAETTVKLLAFHSRSLWYLLDRIPELSKRLLIALCEMKDW